MPLCPPLPESEFSRLAGASDIQVEAWFSRYVADLHRFLNETSSLRTLQAWRSAWRMPREPEAFRSYRCESGHWHTYDHGGRSEAQLNIGMFPDRLRIGLGFDFTDEEQGDPARVSRAHAGFLQAVRANETAFRALVDAQPAEMEVAPVQGGQLELVGTAQLADRLLDLALQPRWLFVGRMLRPATDGSILDSAQSLSMEINRVLMAWVPWWQKANAATR